MERKKAFALLYFNFFFLQLWHGIGVKNDVYEDKSKIKGGAPDK